MFQIHPQLAADTLPVLTLGVSQVLLMNDSRYPWIILVPERTDLRELHDLNEMDYRLVWAEIRRTSLLMTDLSGAHKINVAALGNMVPQLHIHVIARQMTDAAWPAPVWGKGDAVPYAPESLNNRISLLREAFQAS
ncbi:MAG: HIT family protein [Sneathiella sp.]|nr:HIT family protein [Sneathiella sp.]